MMAARRRASEPVTGVISVRPSAAPPSDPTASGRFAAWHDDLAAMIAHDLKTPIAAVVMNLDYVLSELPADTPESVRAALEDCRAANQASSRIVADMTDVARVDAGKLRPAFAEIDVG